MSYALFVPPANNCCVSQSSAEHEISMENAPPFRRRTAKEGVKPVSTQVCAGETDAGIVYFNPRLEFILLPGSGTDMGSISSLYSFPTINFGASVQGDVNCPKCLIK